MALALLGHLLDDERRRSLLSDLYDQNFGIGLLSDDIVRPTSSVLLSPFRSGYLRPWRALSAVDSGVSSFQSDKDEYRINLDVQQFKPEELKVTVNKDHIVVEGKHEERSDEHGFISRQFTRRYKIPKDVDDSTLGSTLSSDGVLTLKARKRKLDGAKGKEIPIIRTNEPAVKRKKATLSDEQQNGAMEKMED